MGKANSSGFDSYGKCVVDKEASDVTQRKFSILLFHNALKM